MGAQASWERRHLARMDRSRAGNPRSQGIRAPWNPVVPTQDSCEIRITFPVMASVAWRGTAAQNCRRQTLLDEIRRRGSISTTEAAALVNATPAVVRRLLDELAKFGLAQPQGRIRARRYYLR